MNIPKQKATLLIEAGIKPLDGDFRLTSAVKNEKALYSYMFLGGRKGRGHLSSKVGEPEDYELEIKSPGFVVERIEFIGTEEDVTHTNENARTALATIRNEAKKVMQGYYHVYVKNTETKEIIDCDPMISNEPRG